MSIPLRVCNNCGLKAYTKEDLERFVKAKNRPHGRITWCKDCLNKYERRRRREKNPPPLYLRKCNDCGIEAWNAEDLNLFVSAKLSKYGKRNQCKKCNKRYVSEGGKYFLRDKKNKREYVLKNREKLREYSMNKIRFKDKRIVQAVNPRTNICSSCGKKHPDDLERQTCLHHTEYDEKDVLANTVELCVDCHNKLHGKLRKELKVVVV